MAGAIGATEPVTAVWLTAILRRAGALPRGAVQSVQSNANAAFNSVTTHLWLTYTAEAPAQAPRRLLLKRSKAAASYVRGGAAEVAFYTLVRDLQAPLPMLAPCYDACFDPYSGRSHVLLEDLSESHRPPLSRDQIVGGDSVPAEEHLGQVVDTLAGFHAYWWGRPLPAHSALTTSEWCGDAARYDEDVRRKRADWARFLAAEGAWFPADLRALYEQAVAGLPRLWERYLRGRSTTAANLTLVHGDCYFCNWLVPYDSTRGVACLIDWQSPTLHIGAADLVNMCATFWTPAQRADGRREDMVLRRYYGGLLAAGVTGYAWHELLTDYKLGLIDWIFYPVWDQTNGSDRDYWWPKLQNLTAAYRAFDCAALLAVVA